jgi:hypothetical protein
MVRDSLSFLRALRGIPAKAVSLGGRAELGLDRL